MRPPMRRLAWIAVAGCLGLVACAHEGAAPPQSAAVAPPPRARPAPVVPAAAPPDEVATALASTQQWLAGLPRCDAATVAAAKDALPGAGASVQLRGRLAAGEPLCTMMACLPSRPCCNSCGWTWLVAPRAAGDRRGGVRVQEAGAKEPLRGSGADCVIDKLPATEVVVKGRLGADVVIDATLCVVNELEDAAR